MEHLRRPDREGYFYRIGDRRFEDGYLFKSYNVRNLSLEEGVPPLEELQRFNQVTVLKSPAQQLLPAVHLHMPGLLLRFDLQKAC